MGFTCRLRQGHTHAPLSSPPNCQYLCCCRRRRPRKPERFLSISCGQGLVDNHQQHSPRPSTANAPPVPAFLRFEYANDRSVGDLRTTVTATAFDRRGRGIQWPWTAPLCRLCRRAPLPSRCWRSRAPRASYRWAGKSATGTGKNTPASSCTTPRCLGLLAQSGPHTQPGHGHGHGHVASLVYRKSHWAVCGSTAISRRRLSSNRRRAASKQSCSAWSNTGPR